MAIKRATHAVYDIKYRFGWIPKYRKDILTKGVKKRGEDLFREIAAHCEFEIDAMKVMSDHVHIFLLAPPGILRPRLWRF